MIESVSRTMCESNVLSRPSSPEELSSARRYSCFSAAVLIPTYQRPRDLYRCLEALKRQTRFPDEVLLVVRDSDEVTRAFFKSYDARPLNVHLVDVMQPGAVAARNQGLAACRSELVCMCDDDTAPHPEWLERIERHFADDERIGGVGGRDRNHDGVAFLDDNGAVDVGRVQWWGRVIGNHHRGVGSSREVDWLKSANMSYRREAVGSIQFTALLRGVTQPSEDLDFSLSVRRAGWKLIYDPSILVDHYCGAALEERCYAEVNARFDSKALETLAFNYTVAMLRELRGIRRVAFVIWATLVGMRIIPGLIQAFHLTPSLGLASWRRFLCAQRGVGQALGHLGRRSLYA